MARHLKTPKDAEGVRREVVQTVAEMLSTIESGREQAVRRYSRELDDWDPDSFLLGREQIAAAAAAVPEETRGHIDFALGQVRSFARAQRETLADLELETLPGVHLGHRHVPVDRVGAYVPGGRYKMLASAFMTVGVAKVAGVPEVVACTPPERGAGVAPLMAYSIDRSGADAVLAIGGVQALATLAYGLFGIEPVSMICGAGNAYVAEAKRQLYGEVGIDLLAGPTEVLVIADESADPELVAIDLLSQAEHGPTSPAVLLTTAERTGRETVAAVERLLAGDWPTADVAGTAWRDYGAVIVAEDHEEALAVADGLASEHVEVQVAEELLEWYLESLVNYGSLFVGSQATVSYGDKGIGTNHVLPTGRAARYTGGLWVGRFLKTLTHQRLSAEGAARIGPSVVAVAEAERMLGHARAVTERLQRNRDGAVR
ncbi:MAG TPA: histidinol dehydrogenase [Solirubrobacterales bacterium]|nr:histidinol dehydrogenase [Solirubrobacterales bacterium]